MYVWVSPVELFYDVEGDGGYGGLVYVYGFLVWPLWLVGGRVLWEYMMLEYVKGM